MSRWHELSCRLRTLFRRPQLEAELNDEIGFHLDMQIQENLRAGMTPEDARSSALRRFGGVEQIKEQCREQRPLRWLASVWQDVRYATRVLLKHPGFTGIVVFTLALAIGANTAIFSVLNAVVLQALPYKDAQRLVMLWEHNPAKGIEEEMVCGASLVEWREQSRSFESIGYVANGSPALRKFVLGRDGNAQWVHGRFASAGFFETLGVAPLLGRVFMPADDERGSEFVGVLSHAFWKQYYGGDPDVIGQTLSIGTGTKGKDFFVWNRNFIIVGVMPPDFQFPPGASFWISYSGHPWFDPTRMSHSQWAVGRLKAGVTARQAAAELTAIQSRLAEAYPQYPQVCTHVKAVPLQEQANGSATGPALLALFGAVVFVLLIACANVANLLLARGAARQKEIAVRIALGAGRGRVIRHLLTESLLLALVGGALGLLLAAWWVKLLPDFQVDRVASVKEFRIDRFKDVQLDWQVLGFSLVVCLGTSLLVGLVPALQASRVNVNASLKEEGRTSTGGVRRHRLRRLLLVSEVALAMVLLIGAGLMMQSFWRIRQIDSGMQPEGVLTAEFDLVMAERAYSGDRHAITRQVFDRVRALPGVKSVAAVGTVPLFKGGSPQNLFLEDERPLLDRPSYPLDRHTVTPGALEVLGIPLLRGRDFTEYDTQRSPRVVIINKTLADRFFPNEDPIGRQIMTHSASWPLKGWVGLEIIGVVGDVRHYDLSAEVSPEVYGSCLQNPIRYWSRPTLVIRTIGEPLGLVDTLRDAVEGEKLRGKILMNIGTLEGILDDSVATEKFSALLLTLFAGVALVLASGGIYGVMSYSTTQRTQELAVRMALGAQPRHVLLLILGEGLTLALIGVVLGLTGCLAGTRVLASLLYGIEPTDPATYVVLATLLVGVALLACYLPARRAMRIDPMAALRYA